MYASGVLDVVIPDLLLPPHASPSLRELRLPHAERWLARADVERLPSQGMTAWLASRFGLEAPYPVAAVTLAADDVPDEGTWLRADPVHLQVTSEVVALHDASGLDVKREEARALVDALQELFADDGLELRMPHETRWYVRLPPEELPRTTPLEEALGRNVFGLLPQGTGRINWRSAITETQMLFSMHAVNLARESEGRPAINSVWFWGGGALPARIERPYALVYADDAFARGLAKVGGVRGAPPPRDPADVDVARENDSVLVVLDALSAPLRRGDEAAWHAAAHALDETWFARLGDLLHRFEAVRIVLPARHETRVATLGAGARWRWFRRGKAVNADA
jgi:hypothetical protein